MSTKYVIVTAALLCAAGLCMAEQEGEETAGGPGSLLERDTLTDGYADHDVSTVRALERGRPVPGPASRPRRRQGRLTRSGGNSASHETATELYYNAVITPWLNITPSVQYIINPGGAKAVNDAVVVGLRLQVSF